MINPQINRDMEKHRFLNDEVFARQFASADLPPVLFSHEAHLRLAWIYLYEQGPEAGEQTVREQIQHYVGSVGAADKYHETLTIAAVRMVSHFMGRSSAEDFPAFIEEFPRLRTHFRELLAQHYSPDRLHSEEARTQWLAPDLLPFG